MACEDDTFPGSAMWGVPEVVVSAGAVCKRTLALELYQISLAWKQVVISWNHQMLNRPLGAMGALSSFLASAADPATVDGA